MREYSVNETAYAAKVLTSTERAISNESAAFVRPGDGLVRHVPRRSADEDAERPAASMANDLDDRGNPA